MATIKEEIARMTVFDEVLENMESRAKYYDNDAEAYLSQARDVKSAHEEAGEPCKDEDIWQYLSYKEYSEKARVIREVACEIEALAMRAKK